MNATAGAYVAGRLLTKIKEDLKKRGCEQNIVLTQYRFHARKLAAEAAQKGFDLIIGVGGDGTMNEIINGMMECRKGSCVLPALGIISAGTGADLCRSLGIPFEYQKALETTLSGKLKTIDIGMVKFKDEKRQWHRYFANVFDIGLGGSVVRIANHIPKRLGGFLTFLLSSLAGLLTYKSTDLKIYVNNELRDKGKIMIIGATNGKYFGGGMNIAPMARLDDGFLEVLYVRDTNLIKFIINVLLPVYDAKHLAYEKLYYFKTNRLKIVSKKVFLADIDGEEEKAKEVEIAIIPQAINVVTD